jgi:hypothetical protein
MFLSQLHLCLRFQSNWVAFFPLYTVTLLFTRSGAVF